MAHFCSVKGLKVDLGDGNGAQDKDWGLEAGLGKDKRRLSSSWLLVLHLRSCPQGHQDLFHQLPPV
jgi:hypothetical protein